MQTPRQWWLTRQERPSRRDLEAAVSTLKSELENRRFKRFNPVASGVPMTYQQFEYERNSKLNGPGKWDIYEDMSNDPHIKAGLRQITLPLVKADWEVEPSSDKPKDQEIAKFVAANLLREGSDQYGAEYFVQTPWKAQRLREILDCLESGFSMFAKSTKIVNGKKVYGRIQWLEPASVDPRGWELTETDEIKRIFRTYETPGDRYKLEEPIDMYQIFLYPWDLKGARFEGRAMTRSMFGAHTRKAFKLQQSSILTQKLGSPMPYGWYPKGFPVDAIPEFIRAVKEMRGSNAAEAFVAGPMGEDGKAPDIGYVGAAHNIDRGFTESIGAENREIRHAAGSPSATLGDGGTGSRSLSDSKGLLEMDLVEAVGEIICEYETHGVANLRGPVEELCDWNFPNVKNYPKLSVNRVNPFAIQMGWTQVIKAWENGLIPRTAQARRQIIETHLGLNLPPDQYDVAEDELPMPLSPALAPQPPQQAPGNPPSPAANPKKSGEKVRDKGITPPVVGDRNGPGRNLETEDEARTRISGLLAPTEDAPVTGGRFRRRTRLEKEYCDLEAVERTFRVGEQAMTVEFRGIHRGMIEDLMTRLRSGVFTPRNIESQRRSNYKRAKKARNAVARSFLTIADEGSDHIADEVERQTNGRT